MTNGERTKLVDVVGQLNVNSLFLYLENEPRQLCKL